MRLKDQFIPQRGERAGAHSRLSLRLILCAIIGAGCVLTSSAKTGSGELSVDSIDARIAVLQKRVDSFSTVMKTLRDDSARAVAPAVAAGSPQAKQLADIQDALAKSRSAAADLKASYNKARQDSVALAEKFHGQLSALRKTGDSLDKAIVAARAAAAIHGGHAAPRDSLADQRAMARLQADASRDDSLLRIREQELAALTAAAAKFGQDSLAAEKQRSDDHARFLGRLHVLDSQVQASDAELDKVLTARASGKTEKTRKIAQLQDTLKQMGSQKQQYADRIAALNKEVGLLGTERATLAKSAGDEQSRYASLRAPYADAVAKAEADAQSLSQDKPVLQALKTKLSLDSQITVARELLDQAIQAQGSRKKGSQAAVDSREANLDTLLAVRDSIAGTTPGLKEREASFAAGGGGIGSLVDSALAANAASVAAAEAVRDAARKNLAQFDQANPPVKSAAPIRLALMDSMIVGKKKEAIELTDLSDSLNILIEGQQKVLNDQTSLSQAEEASADSLARSRNGEKAALVANRVTLQHDMYVADSTDMASILHLRSLADADAKQKATLQAEIDKASAAIAKDKLDLSAIQEKDKLAATSAAGQKSRADSIQAAQQKLLADLTDAQAKNAQDIAALETQAAAAVKAASGPIAGSAAALAENDKTTASLQANLDALRKSSTSGKQSVQDAVKKIETEMAAANKIIDNARNRIAALTEKRATLAAASAQLKKDQDQAMQEFNDIYSLLSNKKIDDASSRFKQDEAFLRKNLDSEHFKAIKSTIQRMVKEGQ
jgi:hypothetical protein